MSLLMNGLMALPCKVAGSTALIGARVARMLVEIAMMF